MTDMLEVTVQGVHRDEGSVVLFFGVTNDGENREVLFAVHGPAAQDLAQALETAEWDINALVEPWQVRS